MSWCMGIEGLNPIFEGVTIVRLWWDPKRQILIRKVLSVFEHAIEVPLCPEMQGSLGYKHEVPTASTFSGRVVRCIGPMIKKEPNENKRLTFLRTLRKLGQAKRLSGKLYTKSYIKADAQGCLEMAPQ